MRILRYIAAAMAILVSGWLLADGFVLAGDLAGGVRDIDLPSHPVARLFIFLTLSLALPFFSAWLLAPSKASKVGEGAPQAGFWATYRSRLIVSLAGVFIVAYAMLAIPMWLTDSGLF